MNNKKTGELISAIRKEMNLSQKDLAEKLNVTDKAVSKWETGRSAPDISILLPLAETLGISVTEILKGERISKEKIHTASDEIIVMTLKKSKLKVFVAVTLVLISLTGLLCTYPAYHYFSTVSDEDIWAVADQAISYAESEELNCIAITQNEDKIAYLFTDGESAYMLLYERDEVFHNRLQYIGMTGATQEIGMYCTGHNGENIFVIFGAYLPEKTKECRLIYKDTEHILQIDDGYILSVHIYEDNAFTNPTIIY